MTVENPHVSAINVSQTGKPVEDVADRYLDLLMRSLTRSLFSESLLPVQPNRGSIRRSLFEPLRSNLAARGLVLARRRLVDTETRAEGGSGQADGETMIGLRCLENLRYCIKDVLQRDVPGDLIETGVWRGGATIFMRVALNAYGDASRVVWAADSFQGLPKPNAEKYPKDTGDPFWSYEIFAVSLDDVRANFARYDLLDERVRFLVGWFSNTLPTAPIQRLAVMRLDGDMYESTMDALVHLYPKLSPGGYAIIDDYGLPGCRSAVDDYRAEHGIIEEMVKVTSSCTFWQRR